MDLDAFLAELATWAEERDPGFETGQLPAGETPPPVQGFPEPGGIPPRPTE